MSKSHKAPEKHISHLKIFVPSPNDEIKFPFKLFMFHKPAGNFVKMYFWVSWFRMKIFSFTIHHRVFSSFLFSFELMWELGCSDFHVWQFKRWKVIICCHLCVWTSKSFKWCSWCLFHFLPPWPQVGLWIFHEKTFFNESSIDTAH